MIYWFKDKLWIKQKLMKPNSLHHLAFLFPPLKENQVGVDAPNPDNMQGTSNIDTQLFFKFYRKYPEILLAAKGISTQPDDFNPNELNPALKFIAKQKKYMNDGFSEAKAFEKAEKDMGSFLQREKKERALLEGMATSNRARSLMSIYEQELEYEARQKVKRMGREIPEFERYQKKDQERMDELFGRSANFKNQDQIEKEKKRDRYNTYDPASCNNECNI